jgi:hypothetical protein
LDEYGEELRPKLYYIWCWWEELSGWREQGMGIGPISHREILAWSTLYQIPVTPSEVAALKIIDTMFRNHEAEKMEANRKDNQSISRAVGDDDTDYAAIEHAKKVAAAHFAAREKEKPPDG